jgi:hypothetical protein
VLEPSPPAVSEPPWFADDPVARGDTDAGKPVVAPVPTADVLWSDVVAERPELARWCSERWLASYRRLPPAPPGLGRTRHTLHVLAEQVIAPARRQANGKIGLRYTYDGFGTPFFGDDAQVRVEGAELVVHEHGRARRAAITTLAEAAEHVGPELLPDRPELDNEPLEIDADAATLLGDWFGFAASVLEEMRAEAGAAADPSRVQLWPEHFDLALELGRAGGRAAYGLSPGDEVHPEPYVYVAPWTAPAPGELWNATAFRGAELSYAELAAAEDQRAVALGFLGARFHALTG